MSCPQFRNSESISKNAKIVLGILQDEVNGDILSARRKMTKDYTMTWMDTGINGNELFPTTKVDAEEDMKDAYVIKGRQYDIKNIAEGKNLVMIELVESYPSLKTKRVYRTPLVLVLEMKNGKIRTGRHYLDPRISQKFLTKKQIEKAYKKQVSSFVITK